MNLPDTATLAQAGKLLQQIEAVPADAASMRIDASALQNFDTSLVAVLLAALRLAEARSLPFQIVSPPAKLAELAALYGVGGLLSLSSAGSEPARPPAT